MSENMVIIIIWIVSGVISYGINFAYFIREPTGYFEKDYYRYMIGSMIIGFGFGFPGLVISFLMHRLKYGLKFW